MSPPPPRSPNTAGLHFPDFANLLPLDGIKRLVTYVNEFVTSIGTQANSHAKAIQDSICSSCALCALKAIGRQVNAPDVAVQVFEKLLAEGTSAARQALDSYPRDANTNTLQTLLGNDQSTQAIKMLSGWIGGTDSSLVASLKAIGSGDIPSISCDQSPVQNIFSGAALIATTVESLLSTFEEVPSFNEVCHASIEHAQLD